MQAVQLWVDTDIALGATSGDVDDGFALAALVRAAQRRPQDIRLLGISAIAGNTDADSACRCATELLRVAGFELGVTPAADAAARIAALPAGATVLCLGPLTHLAQALEMDCELSSRIRVSMVSGVLRRWAHPWLPLLDLNARRDTAALRLTLRAPLRERRVFPLDVVQRLRIGARDLANIGDRGVVGAYLKQHSQRWLMQTRLRHLSRRFPVWDLVAALHAVGQLPGAEFEGERLIGFDTAAAFDVFVGLLGLHC